MLHGLLQLGYEVTLLSNALAWHQQSSDDDVIARLGVSKLILFEPTASERRLLGALQRVNRSEARIAGTGLWQPTPPSMRSWFKSVRDRVQPDLFYMSYPWWDAAIDHDDLRNATTLIDVYFVTALAEQYWSALGHTLSEEPVREMDPELLVHDYAARLPTPDTTRECRTYDKYDATLVLSTWVAGTLRSKLHHTLVSVVPLSHEVVSLTNSYSGPPVFITGRNPVNVQAYFFFAHRVMPEIRARSLDFRLVVIGAICSLVPPVTGSDLLGYSTDIRAIYETASFAVCPLLVAPGPLTKVIEAMAHGLPVVVMKVAADVGLPIENGVNGFVADDAVQFAEYCVQLWRDRNLCRRMGAKAREAIAETHSRPRLTERLGTAISAARHRKLRASYSDC